SPPTTMALLPFRSRTAPNRPAVAGVPRNVRLPAPKNIGPAPTGFVFTTWLAVAPPLFVMFSRPNDWNSLALTVTADPVAAPTVIDPLPRLVTRVKVAGPDPAGSNTRPPFWTLMR